MRETESYPNKEADFPEVDSAIDAAAKEFNKQSRHRALWAVGLAVALILGILSTREPRIMALVVAFWVACKGELHFFTLQWPVLPLFSFMVLSISVTQLCMAANWAYAVHSQPLDKTSERMYRMLHAFARPSRRGNGLTWAPYTLAVQAVAALVLPPENVASAQWAFSANIVTMALLSAMTLTPLVFLLLGEKPSALLQKMENETSTDEFPGRPSGSGIYDAIEKYTEKRLSDWKLQMAEESEKRAKAAQATPALTAPAAAA